MRCRSAPMQANLLWTELSPDFTMKPSSDNSNVTIPLLPGAFPPLCTETLVCPYRPGCITKAWPSPRRSCARPGPDRAGAANVDTSATNTLSPAVSLSSGLCGDLTRPLAAGRYAGVQPEALTFWQIARSCARPAGGLPSLLLRTEAGGEGNIQFASKLLYFPCSSLSFRGCQSGIAEITEKPSNSDSKIPRSTSGGP
jgi:hypothetical protein